MRISNLKKKIKAGYPPPVCGTFYLCKTKSIFVKHEFNIRRNSVGSENINTNVLYRM